MAGERIASDVCLLSLERGQKGGLKPASSLGVVWLNLCLWVAAGM